MSDVDRKPDPQLAGATEAFVHERASATPTHAQLENLARPRLAAAGVSPRTPVRATLKDLQEWFASSVMHPRSLEEGVVAHRLLSRADGKLIEPDQILDLARSL